MLFCSVIIVRAKTTTNTRADHCCSTKKSGKTGSSQGKRTIETGPKCTDPTEVILFCFFLAKISALISSLALLAIGVMMKEM